MLRQKSEIVNAQIQMIIVLSVENDAQHAKAHEFYKTLMLVFNV